MRGTYQVPSGCGAAMRNYTAFRPLWPVTRASTISKSCFKTFLIEHFRIKLHHEPKMFAERSVPDIGAVPPQLDAASFPVMPLGHGVLSTHSGLPFQLDKTGLTDKYDFTLEYDDDSRAIMAGRGVSGGDGGTNFVRAWQSPPDIFKALQQQLGLKLVKTKDIPRDTIVIDHAERISAGN